ncbi:MAG: hypothetical protein HEP71_26315 [Roseivirga sp.]|nr:hypothetical protein [Roseivirga sp.]
MKKLIYIIGVLLIGMQWSYAQSKEESKAKIEYLKPIEIADKKKNEYTGKYAIEGEELASFIEIEINQDAQGKSHLSIILPSKEESQDGYEATVQYTLIAQYEDKFYLKHDAFIKVHFTRSKKNNEIISLLYNAGRNDGIDLIRAKKVR